MVDVVRRTAEQVFVPLTVGGGVRSVDDVDRASARRRRQGRGEHRRHRAPGAPRQRSRSGSATRCWCSRVDARRCAGRHSTASGYEVTTHGGTARNGDRRHRVGARGRGARRGRDPAELDGRRRHDRRLRPRRCSRRFAPWWTCPLIASGGAGAVEDFVAAARAGRRRRARRELSFTSAPLSIGEVKERCVAAGIEVR